MKNKNVKRIEKMEEILDNANRIMDELEEKFEELREYQGKIKELEEYYTGEDWKEDFKLDEEGKLIEARLYPPAQKARLGGVVQGILSGNASRSSDDKTDVNSANTDYAILARIAREIENIGLTFDINSVDSYIKFMK